MRRGPYRGVRAFFALFAAAMLASCGGAPDDAIETSADTVVLTADLRSSTTSTDGRVTAVGTATIHVERRGARLCADVDAGALTDVLAVHIERGRIGSSRQIVMLLPEPSDYSPACADASRSVLDDLLDDPLGHVVNVRTRSAPDGAMEGELRSL